MKKVVIGIVAFVMVAGMFIAGGLVGNRNDVDLTDQEIVERYVREKHGEQYSVELVEFEEAVHPEHIYYQVYDGDRVIIYGSILREQYQHKYASQE